MTSKQRSYLKGLAMTMDPIFQIGKSSVTPELTAAIAEALEARELRSFRSSARRLFFISRQRTRQSARSFCLNPVS